MESLTESNMDLEADVEATFRFTDPDDLRRTLRVFFNDTVDQDSLCDRTILVTGFPVENFIIDDDNQESLIPRKGKALYLEDSKTLVFTMPGPPHEIASRLFGRQLDLKLIAMNCLEDSVPAGGATREMANVKKEPDESWGPRGTTYITCALEAAVSESNRALHRDAKVWLEHPESHVTQVVTIKVSRTRPEIVFSVWKITRQERETRAQYPQHATLDHEVHTTLVHGRPIADGSICLSFEELFERRPQLGTAERDIVFSTREIGGMARVVWEFMGFIPRQ